MALFKKALVKFYLGLCNGLLHVLKKILYKPVLNPNSIIIFRNGSMGDGIAAMPAILALKEKFADSKFILMTNTGLKNLVSLPQLIDKSIFDDVIDYQNKSLKETFSLVKKTKSDTIIQLPQSKAKLKHLMRDVLFFKLAGISSGFGWNKYHVPFFRNFQDNHRQIDSERHRLLQIVQNNVDIGKTLEENYSFNITDQDNNIISKLRDEHKLNGNFLVAVVGAKRPQNRWPISHFNQLIESFIDEFQLPVVLIGGPDDNEIAQNLKVLNSCINLIGKLTPVQSGILMSKATVVVSNDTGPMHLAYSNKTPVIALFSSRDFKNLWFPPDNESNIVFRTDDVHCKLCLSETCTNNICMQQIQPNQVFKAVKKFFV